MPIIVFLNFSNSAYHFLNIFLVYTSYGSDDIGTEVGTGRFKFGLSKSEADKTRADLIK